MLWVLVVGPALARALGSFTHGVDNFSCMSVGQIVFVLPFSAMFAGLTALFGRLGILREILAAAALLGLGTYGLADSAR